MARSSLNFTERAAISLMASLMQATTWTPKQLGRPTRPTAATLATEAWEAATVLANARPDEPKAQAALPSAEFMALYGPWTREDSANAIREGWDVFDNSDYGLEIERIDDPDNTDPMFGSDMEAIAHVYSMAKASALHRKALLLTIGNI